VRSWGSVDQAKRLGCNKEPCPGSIITPKLVDVDSLALSKRDLNAPMGNNVVSSVDLTWMGECQGL